VRFVIGVPHRGGVGRVEEDPGIHSADVTVAEEDVVTFSAVICSHTGLDI